MRKANGIGDTKLVSVITDTIQIPVGHVLGESRQTIFFPVTCAIYLITPTGFAGKTLDGIVGMGVVCGVTICHQYDICVGTVAGGWRIVSTTLCRAITVRAVTTALLVTIYQGLS